MKQKKKALRTGREYQNCAPPGVGRRHRVPHPYVLRRKHPAT
jgi:hypothetical protein